MKKIFSFIVLLAGVAMFTSCSDDDTVNPYAHQSTITVEKADVSFDANGGTGSVQVSSASAISVAVPAETQWLTAAVAGNAINVTVEPNPNVEGRSAQLTIKNASDEVYVTVAQTGLVSRLSTYELQFTDAKGTQAIAFKHDVPVKVQSLTDWVAVQQDDENGRILVGVASNDDKAERMGKVLIESADVSDTLYVYQDAMVFELETDSYMFSSNAASDVKVKVDHSKPVVVKSFAEWIDASFDDSDSTIVVKVTANDGTARLGYVGVQSGTSVEYLAIGQYEFAQEVASGYYYFWYMDASDNQWHYMPAMLSVEENSMILAMSDQLMFTLPVIADEETQALYAGPSTTFAGMYGPYYLYWVWRSLAGTWSGYTGKMYSVGTIDFSEDEDGNLLKSIIFGGQLGNNTIDAWALRAMTAEGLSADNNAGYLTTFYFPQMEPMPMEARGKQAKGVRTFRGHNGTPANSNSLKYVLRLEN